MRITISTLQMREMLTMIIQQLLSVVWFVASQQGTKGFFLEQPTDHIHRMRRAKVSFASKSFASKSPIPTEKEEEENEGTDDTTTPTKEEPSLVRKNDLSMFLATEEEDRGGGFDPLEFFMTVDDPSIQKLEEVEDFFRKEPMGIMMEEQAGVVPSIDAPPHNKMMEHIATTNPVASDKIKMAHNTDSISIEEEPPRKRVMYYDYDGSLAKIKGNLCDSPIIYYTE